MMKWIVVAVLFFSIHAFAWEVVVDRTNHLGYRNVDLVQQEKGVVRFNGKELSRTFPKPVEKSLDAIKNGPDKGIPSHCAAGTYTYIKKDSTKESRITGCSAGEKYADLIEHLETLRAFAKKGQQP